MLKFTLFGLVIAASAFPCAAQTQADLKDYFEGKEVVVKIDMPGDKSGVDIRLDEPRPIDYSELGKRIKRYGVSIRRGDRAMVTLVKVNKKNIEFQLSGGGFGTLGDPTGAPSINTNVPKSDREKRLEEDVKKETDRKRRERLEEELDRLRRRRESEEARLEAEAAQARILAEARERQLRLDSGSRFNLWFERAVPSEALTPGAVMAALSDYIDFSDEKAGENLDENQPSQAFSLRKGLTEEAVDGAYGQPAERSVESFGDLTVVRSVYSVPEGELRAIFVEGVLVRYSVVSR
jgi:hypothetical protein